MDNNDITFFGLTSFRNARKKFGIRTDDRRRHFYIIGKTGMGKSNMMENMAIQDIQAGRGVAYVDPHGEGAEKILDFVPDKRINDVIYINPADLDYPIAFNVMEQVDPKYRHLVASGLMGVFKKVWPDVWSARMEYILNNSILALLEYPDATLLGVNRMFADIEYRKRVVDKITDPIVKSFWVTEYARYTQRYEIEATAAIQNKVGQFISNPLIRNIIGQTQSTINMRDMMDKQRILIMNLSKGKIGEDNSKLLGALLITKLQLAAMSRVDIPEEIRKDFYLYVDEFQNFATESFTNILSEARKYRLNLILGHQYITQMEETVRDAVFGNVGTLAVFRVGAEDAEFLEKEFSPEFTAVDLCNLPKYNIYIKLMIDGVAGHPFSAETLPPPALLDISNKDKIIKASQTKYGVKSEIVQEIISNWSGFLKPENPQLKPEQIIKKEEPIDKTKAVSSDNQPTLYDAICSMCQKPTKVVFQPEQGRPIYCKSCLKKIRSPGGQGNNVKTADKDSAEEVNKITTIPFHNPKKQPQKPIEEKPKRKEINLSELKKALEESLKDDEESGKVEETEKIKDKVDEKNKVVSLNENKTEEEEDKLDQQKKGVIRPGQTVKF
ncbi:MAG: type IV secretion system DNA-binding domain-containing protein [Candidatus Staskawiczbacteria bacterium]|nr:type IV secretion system DNA-binding domain-containing protein [Candidatus Staskawiczbacteria bacterium]